MNLKTGLLAFCLATATLSGSMHAFAAPAKNDQFADIDCTKDQESTLGMKVCAGRELEKTQKALKAQRQKLMKAADKDMRKVLAKWFKSADTYADAKCAVEGQRFAGGTMETLAYGGCLIGEYDRQLKELVELENRPEGS